MSTRPLGDTVNEALRRDDVWGRAPDLPAESSATGRRAAVEIPDLLVAAVADRHRVTVLQAGAEHILHSGRLA